MDDLANNKHSATPISKESPKSDVEVPQGHDPYEPPASELIEVDEVSETDELKAYVGDKTDYYLNQWKYRSYRFNWAAFFLTGLWMAYRNMYWQFLAILGATIVLSLVEQTLAMPTWISTLAVGLVCGFFGNKWYHSHTLRVVRKTRLKEPRADERIILLAKRGGTSTILVIAVIVIAVIVIASLLYSLFT